MKIVITVAAIDPRFGGPSRTVPALAASLCEAGAEVELITVGEGGRSPHMASLGDVKTTVVPTSRSRYNPVSWRPDFVHAVEHAAASNGRTVIYDVGLWLPSNHFAANAARKLKLPFISSPRGMLSQHALSISRWRKKLAWWTYQRRDLERANALHGTSAGEAADIRRAGVHQPIAVVPNGVHVPPATRETPAQVKTALFLSRLHPIKGLPDLLSAWARVRPSGWKLVIAGPDEGDYQARVTAEVQRLALKREVTLIGAVDDSQKWSVYRSASLFILPSYSESFGQVIAEALAAGVPVVTTQATPWQELESEKCGWWVPVGTNSLVETLEVATNISGDELKGMGARGRQLIETKYSWGRVGEQLLATFEWVASGGIRPACIV